MRITRIFHPEPLQPGQETELQPQAGVHLTRVMRMKEGYELTLFNGDGHNYPARISSIKRNQVRVEILSRQADDRESPLMLTLVQGISRGDRMDYTIQKAVELGIQRIVPVYSERSMTLDDERMEKKHAHWLGVVTSACEQCGRTRIPELDRPVDLRHWLDGHDTGPLRLILDPTADTSLGGLPQPAAGITLLVGPEGGLSENEIHMAESQGFTGIRLGPRILRTETAAVAILGAIQAMWGDFR